MTTQLPSDLPTFETVPPTALPGGDIPTLEPTQPRTPQPVTPEITEEDNEGGGLPTTERNEVPSSDNEITSEEKDDGEEEGESSDEDDGNEEQVP